MGANRHHIFVHLQRTDEDNFSVFTLTITRVFPCTCTSTIQPSAAGCRTVRFKSVENSNTKCLNFRGRSSWWDSDSIFTFMIRRILLKCGTLLPDHTVSHRKYGTLHKPSRQHLKFHASKLVTSDSIRGKIYNYVFINLTWKNQL